MTIPSWEGPETLVASGTITAQFFPEIAALQGGGFVVVWRDQSGHDARAEEAGAVRGQLRERRDDGGRGPSGEEIDERPERGREVDLGKHEERVSYTF